MLSLLRRALLFVALMVVLGEILFRTLVPAAQAPAQAQDPEFRVMKMDASLGRSGHFSVGRLARHRCAWRVNNFGWNSAIDYRGPAERERPAIAVFGDSYIEGFFCDVRDNFCAGLQRKLDDRYEVYNLGKSGNNFAQALPVARYAQRHFAPDIIIIATGYGGVTRSLRNYHAAPTILQFRAEGDSLREVPPIVYRPRRASRLLLRSAIVRYLWLNAGLIKGAGAMRQEAMRRDDAADPAARALEMERRDVERRLIETVVSRLAVENPRTPILVVVDADRRAMYGASACPPPLSMSDDIGEACARHGLHHLDLTATFWSAWQRDGRPFNFPDNYHWNEYGYGIVAEAVAGAVGDIAGGPPAGGNGAAGRP